MEANTGSTLALRLMDIVHAILPVTGEDARRCVALFERYGPLGVSARDLGHVAVMQGHGIEAILSTDRNLDLIDGIRRLDPAQLHHAA
jgi:predicted nucleic acid-binding protein